MHDKTFAELYCERRALDPEDYTEAVFHEALYPHARVALTILRLFSRRHFEADYAFVEGVASLHRLRDYQAEAVAFSHHPQNRGFWRSTLNFRISSRRLRRIVRQVLHPENADAHVAEDQSLAPFGKKGEGAPRRKPATGPAS